MKHFKKIFFFTVLAVIVLGTFAFLYYKSRPKPLVYEQVTPAVKDIKKITVVTGSIVPRDEINIKPQISGIISELYKKAGEMVKEGEVIAKVKVIPEMSSLSSAQSRVRLSEINLSQAKTNFEREKALYEKQLVSAEEYDKVKQALDQAKEEYDAAQETLEVIRDGVSKRNASSSSTLIRSTISGLILDIPVKVGNSVILSNTFNDGTTIATVADMTDLIFDGKVDEVEVGRLSEGMPVVITIGALQDLKLDANLEYVSPKALLSNGANQFQIKAAINIEGDAMIRSGYSANAEIVLESAEQVLCLPESTISFSGDTSFVYLYGDGKDFERRVVETGLSDGVDIEIKSGIQAEEIIRGNVVLQ